ncbi:MAG TPA: hemolysin III family protein [Candidatus Paceibacterota bacterium]
MEGVAKREPLSSLSHFLGTILSIVALVFLILTAAQNGTIRNIVGFTVFGVSLILLYASSSIYHFLRNPKHKGFFKRLDRAMIYVLIAGTYTAIALSIPSRGWGWSLFGVEWGLAVLGITMEFTGFRYKKYVAQVLYLGMGWLAVMAFPVLLSFLSETGLLLLIGGGVFYTIGFLFFVLDRYIPARPWFSMHDIFHFFVLAGSASHFLLVFRHVL